ncbi:MAG: phosphate signaling complex protein PhoU [Candidatus Lokiarchaeota archaeon]|nr:phosphate signaling complex protein PhoU [Candidatus Lokiarchaeota archaeon]MBD3337672.1 phosphate signaling complex protein PhoU [Candidatus Lokiarchaeota archaeon]
MAKELHREILELKIQVNKMGQLALSMLEDSVKSLNDKDPVLAKQVVDKKHDIRDFDDEIEERALKLIALYQPMAIDLRRIATILKVITYLHRIGRYGKDIAQVVRRDLAESKVQLKLVNLQHIFEHVREMVEDVLKAFDEADIKYIQDFEERDDEVDELRWSIFRECITYMMEEPKYITICAHYIMFARYLERCGDHACKIAEKVHYMVTGKHTEIS